MTRFSCRTALRVLTTVLAVVSASVVPAGPAAPAAPLRAETAVVIDGSGFTPRSVTVRPGDTVRWTNEDDTEHKVTSDGGDWAGVLAPGTSYTRAFPAKGRFAYHCTVSPDAPGSVVVE
ncbi:cupredoxin domain-containing protein [Streptomyces sp. NPDC059785]|uniref:cupredoxin domain-containing protein n=1 Tax=unclassified Streptomyces TaxID=2593676 RepID=UPI0036625A49